jgi:hypothetical protein
MEHPATSIFIHRLAKLWKVAPFRIDAKIRVDGSIESLTLDDKFPDLKYIDLLERDVKTVVGQVRGAFN